MSLTPEAGYLAWRARVPFTDEQIITALEAYRDQQPNEWTRTGAQMTLDYFAKSRRLSAKTLSIILNHLVTTCGICGAKALYRFGYHGRCKTHKLDMPKHEEERRARIDAKAGRRNAARAEFDKSQQNWSRQRKCSTIGKGRK
jgi:hypothetical protein